MEAKLSIRDNFKSYYSEKLWEMIPAIYRHEDGLDSNPNPHVLRALVEVIAEQAAILRRSQDRLWEDQFIEWCDDWAVPYIGDLVGTRMLSALNKEGCRKDVANTIYYRRRKGTPRILEKLIFDISGWEGKLTEQFQKLGRSRHGLDQKPQNLAGRYSGTMPGGFADLRNQRISELANGPFEEYHHTPDMRRHRGLNGRYGIPKLAFYLYRLRSFPIIESTPFSLEKELEEGEEEVRFMFDPSGRDIPLFGKRLRADDWDEWHSPLEWELPAPIPCRLLSHAVYRITELGIRKLIADGLGEDAGEELRQLSGMNFKDEISLLRILETLIHKVEILDPVNYKPLLSVSLVSDCGKQALLPDKINLPNNPSDSSSIAVGYGIPMNAIIPIENITAANLENWTYQGNEELGIDAEKGRFKFNSLPNPEQPLTVRYHYGFSGTIGAGPYNRPWIRASVPDQIKSGGGEIAALDMLKDGITQIEDSKTYDSISNKYSIISLVLQADNYQRPYVRLRTNWILNSGSHENSKLVLDGLWLGAFGNLTLEIILKGNYECVIIKNCTLDPGGSNNALGETLMPLTLVVSGFVENLCIESSILGPIRLESSGIVEEISIQDSIIQSIDPSIKALLVNGGKTKICRSTIYGQIEVHRLEATETIITGRADVTDTQNGCFRFSAAPGNSRLPRPYESFLFQNDANHWFTSRRFGDPGFGQLTETTPIDIVRGAENGSEMGAFSSLINPIKMDGLRAKIDEYMPFGLIPIFINKT